MEHCFRIGGDVCSECHSKIHDIAECYWQQLPTKLQQLLPNFAPEDMHMEHIVQFWHECTQFQLFGTDEEFDIDLYREVQFARVSSFVLAIDYILKG